MLGDPGIGWHLKAGDLMLQSKSVLRHDLFSYTKPGETWTTFEWLFQCIIAFLENIGGLPLVSAIFALVYGILPLLLYRRMLLENVNIYLAFILSLVASLALIHHAHARPHVFTYIFFTLLLERIILFERKMVSSRTIYVFIPLMILWANLHGGFAAGIAVVGLSFAVACVKYFVGRSKWEFEKLRTYFIVGLGMFLVSMINPFGWHLHIGILEILNLESLPKMAEFSSPNFNSGLFYIMVFEIIILSAFLMLKQNKTSFNWTEIILVVFFLHQALHAVRHIFLFIIITIPFLGRELSGVIKKKGWFLKHSEETMFEQKQLKSSLILLPTFCLAIIVLSQSVSTIFRHDLYELNLTKGAGNYIESNIEKFERTFNTENLGGAIIYHFWPKLSVFGDDRNDFYGDDFYLNDYAEVLHAKPKWHEVLNKYETSSAIISKYKPLISLFKTSNSWNLVYNDEKVHIFMKKTNI